MPLSWLVLCTDTTVQTMRYLSPNVLRSSLLQVLLQQTEMMQQFCIKLLYLKFSDRQTCKKETGSTEFR